MIVNVEKVLRNTRITAWTHRVLTIASGLIVTKILISTTGTDGYAAFSIYVSIFSLLLACDFGLYQASTRFIARFNKEGSEPDLKNSLPSAILYLLLLITLLQGIILVGIALGYNTVDPKITIDADLLLVSGSFVVFAFLFGINKSIFSSLQMYGLHGIGKIINSVLYIASFLIMYLLDQVSLVFAVYSFALSKLISSAIMITVLISLTRNQSRDLPLYAPTTPRQIKDLLNYGVMSWFFGLSTVIYANLSVIGLGVLADSDSVTMLRISLLVFSLMAAPITAILTPLTTITSQFLNSAQDKKVGRTLLSLHVDVVSISAASCVLYYFFGEVFVSYLLGASEITRQTFQNTLLLVTPVILSMPLFVYRYMLVDKKQNAQYSSSVLGLIATSVALGLLYVFTQNEISTLLVAISLALTLRSVLAYLMVYRTPEAPRMRLFDIGGHLVFAGCCYFSVVWGLEQLFTMLELNRYIATIAATSVVLIIYFTSARPVKNRLIARSDYLLRRNKQHNDSAAI